jgi:hypothetical protein
LGQLLQFQEGAFCNLYPVKFEATCRFYLTSSRLQTMFSSEFQCRVLYWLFLDDALCNLTPGRFDATRSKVFGSL